MRKKPTRLNYQLGCGLAALTLFFALQCSKPVQASPPNDKLNVLFFAVDDLRPELNCYGSEHIISPNIDDLASKGVLFSHAYCQQAVCSPSRTSLMTGLRPDSTKVYDLETHFRDTVPDVVTLTQQFMKHGYAAIGMGKIFHGSLNDEASWSIPHWRPSGVNGYNIPANQEYCVKRRIEGKKKGLTGKTLSRYSNGPPTECADVPDNMYPDGAVAEHAVETLQKLAAGDQPFFLAVGFTKPHLPFNSPKKYWDLYDRDEITVCDQTDWPEGAPAFAGTSWGELRNYKDIPKEGPVSEQQARTLRHGYYAATSFTDANVGKVVRELERLGMRDNTVIIIWGDHGWKLGEYGAWCKHTNFELDTHVPMIVSMPGAMGNGSKSDALVEFVDIYPTLVDLARLPLPSHLEGASFTPVLESPDMPWKKAAFSQYPRGGGNNRIMGYSMRTPEYRFTRWVNRDNPSEVHAVELYDHRAGDQELVNIADRPENAELVKQLLQQSEAGWQAATPSNQ